MAKSIVQSKTFWFNLLTGVVSVAGPISGLVSIAALPYVAAVVAVANIGLRLVSTTPVTVTGTSKGETNA